MAEENVRAIMENMELGSEKRNTRAEKPKTVFNSLHNIESEASDDEFEDSGRGIERKKPKIDEKPAETTDVTPKITSSTKKRAITTKKRLLNECVQTSGSESDTVSAVIGDDLENLDNTSGRTDQSSRTVLLLKRPSKKYVKAGIHSADTAGHSSLEPFRPSLKSALERNRSFGFTSTFGDFVLPYDYWWHYRYQREFKHLNPSVDYRKLRTNVYFDGKPIIGLKHDVCSCGATDTCSSDCLNRVMFIECDPNKCPCKERCTNNCMQKREWLQDTEVFDCCEKGVGVRTKVAIDKGTFVCEYVGEVVSRKTFTDRMATWYKDCDHHYALSVDAVTYIDAYRSGSIARFINHSCNPNCEMEKWFVNGCYRMGIFALRDIEPDEELCFDYKFHAFQKPQLCLCGSENCRGVVGIGGSEDRQMTRKGKPKRSIERGDFTYIASRSRGHKFLALMKPVYRRERLLVTKGRLFLNRNVDGERRKLKSHMDAQSWTLVEDSRKTEIIDYYFTERGKAHVRWRRLTNFDNGARLKKLIPLARHLKLKLGIVTRIRSKPNYYVDGHQVTRDDQPVDTDKLLYNAESGRYASTEAFNEDVVRLLGQLKAKYTPSDDDIHSSLRNLEQSYESKKLVLFGQTESDGSRAENSSKIGRKDQPDELYWARNVPLIGTYEVEEGGGSMWAKKADSFDEKDDKVHCVCGKFYESGKMIQCERCLYWQHCDCIGDEPMVDGYVCDFCASGDVTICREVVAVPQPKDGLKNCVYYHALMKDGFQVRTDEFVYVEKIVDDSYKQLLLTCYSTQAAATPTDANTSELLDFSMTDGSEQSPQKPIVNYRGMYRRSDLRIFCVERLFVGPKGAKFVFGRYFARPHETRCDPGRLFYRNEVFDTPIYDTLPIDAVIGRCLVLDAWTYCQGRPRHPKCAEEEVYICQYRLDKQQGLYNNMRAIHLPQILKEPYLFEKFPDKLKLKRDFSPFTKMKNRDGPLSGVGSNYSSMTGLQTDQARTEEEASAAVRDFVTAALEKRDLVEQVIEKLRSALV